MNREGGLYSDTEEENVAYLLHGVWIRTNFLLPSLISKSAGDDRMVDMAQDFDGCLGAVESMTVVLGFDLLPSSSVTRQNGVPPKGSYGKEGKGAEGGVY